MMIQVRRFRLAAVIFSILATRLAVAADERIPEPAAPKHADAEKLVLDVYKEDFAKRGPDERRALAKRMIEDAKTTNDPATQYVLLEQARDIGISLADIELTMNGCTEMSQRFVVSGPDLKLKALIAIKPTLKGSDGNQAGGEAAMAVTDEAIAVDDFDVASKALEQAIAFATAAKNIQLASDANLRKADVRTQATAFFEYKVGMEHLKAEPANAQAKYAVGNYLCLYRNEWDKGLALTAECSDSAWAQVSKLDKAAPVAAPEMMKVADAWYDLGANREGLRGRIWVRAEFWYNLLLPNLEGVQKARVEKRLEQIAQVKPMMLGAVSEATKKALPTSEELRKLRDLCVAARAGGPKNAKELTAYVGTLTQRVGKDITEGKEADFFARCRGELQIRKTLDANGCVGYNSGATLLMGFVPYAALTHTKEDLAGRLVALDRYNQQEKTLDDTALETMVASSVRQFVTNNSTMFSTPKMKTDLVAYLKTKAVPAKGLDRFLKTMPPAPKATIAPPAAG